MSLLARRRPKPSINIVPLMDVLTILIFFFLVSMQFKELTTLNLTLPQIETAARNEETQSVQITIDAEGTVFLESRQVSMDELRTALAELEGVGPETPVLLRADRSTPLEIVTNAMDACRVNGLSRIRLQAR